ncbi:unnamed protein product [Cuscuta campestris]|uniref:Uncharacterized protein n=2 Tax=Cuscuta sect. Cleistogrammica TaxID=1824901 RepID=A0A484L3Y4_9ASTE|nr:hypothetical protein DM860_000287 [Cuscuta australis]VFQ71008.1 unnamed protein product [Cuscuta campestris]
MASANNGKGNGNNTGDEQGEKPAGLEVALGVAAVALISWLGSMLFGGGRPTMRAPGRPQNRIFRDEFERDPASYFRDLRGNE